MKYITFGAILLAPTLALAQSSGVSGPLGNTLVQIMAVIQQLIPMLMALAVLMFFWGIVKFIANINDEEARKAGKHLMVWGMIALFVMVGFWGIIGYVQESLGLYGPTPVGGTAPTLGNMVPQFMR